MRVKRRGRAYVTGSGSVAAPFSPVAGLSSSCDFVQPSFTSGMILGVLTFGVESVSAADLGDAFQTFFFSNLKSNFCLTL